MPIVKARAAAKINLGLRVLERREDGFHELRTVFQTISLYDRLTVAFTPGPRRRVEFRCDEPALDNSGNLAARAARKLLRRGPWRGCATIELRKGIPHAAGMGGGSSDAAAVLLSLAQLLDPPPSRRLLWETAADLGSDAPFFLVGGRAVGLGRGEEVYPLPDPPRSWLLIAVPPIEVSTPEAYRALDAARRPLTAKRERLTISSFCSGIRVSGESVAQGLAEVLSNDFEGVVFRRFPELRELRDRLASAGASAALLSGSGSALFGLFESRGGALAAQESFRGFDGRTFVASAIGRRAYRAGFRLVSE